MKYIVESSGFRFIFSSWVNMTQELQNIFGFLVHFGSSELIKDNVVYRVEF